MLTVVSVSETVDKKIRRHHTEILPNAYAYSVSVALAWKKRGHLLAACGLAPCFATRVRRYVSHVLLAHLRFFRLQMEAFNHLMLEYPELMYGGVGATAFVAGGALIYKIVTRYRDGVHTAACF